MKRLWIFIGIILTTALLGHNAQAADMSFEIYGPGERADYDLGDSATIRWKVNGFEPSQKEPIELMLFDRSTRKKIRIARIAVPEANGEYEFMWDIPDDLFERRDLMGTDVNFKLYLRTYVNGQWVRKYSKRSLLHVLKEGNSPRIQIINTTVPTEVNVAPEPPSEPELSVDGKTLASSYTFQANPEPWIVDKLTVVNDTQGDGFDADATETADVIDSIYLRYPNEAGNLEVKQAVFSGGKATFSGLNFFIDKRSTATVEVFVDPIDVSKFTNFSGSIYRVGIQDQGNNSSSFNAVGQFSGSTINSLSSVSISSQQVEEFIVQAGKPVFSLNSPQEQELLAGSNDLYSFSISSASNISIGRLVFDVTTTDVGTLDNVQLFRDGSLLNPSDDITLNKVYLRWDAGATSCFAHLDQASGGMNCAGGTQSSAKLIVTFAQPELLLSKSRDYVLRMNVNPTTNQSVVSVKLAIGDDFAKPSISGSTNGKIYNNGVGGELFSVASDYVSEASTITDRNIIWSDRSADLHLYPQITASAMPTVNNGSSADWTNGYLLKVNVLPAVISVR